MGFRFFDTLFSEKISHAGAPALKQGAHWPENGLRA
jgi:hypothetical protein